MVRHGGDCMSGSYSGDTKKNIEKAEAESFGCMICAGPLGEDDHTDDMGDIICDDCWNNL